MMYIMKEMKSIKVIGYGLWVMGMLLVSMPAMAQFSNNDPFAATAPTTTFHSTSTLTGSGSEYSSNPTISDNGSATQPYAAPRMIGARRNDGGSIAPPDDEDEDYKENPIGDALLPLMLLAVGYAAARRRVKAC